MRESCKVLHCFVQIFLNLSVLKTYPYFLLLIEIATMQNLTKFLLGLFLMILSLNGIAQKKSKSSQTEVVLPTLVDAKNFQSLKWRNIGPFREEELMVFQVYPGIINFILLVTLEGAYGKHQMLV